MINPKYVHDMTNKKNGQGFHESNCMANLRHADNQQNLGIEQKEAAMKNRVYRQVFRDSIPDLAKWMGVTLSTWPNHSA